MRDQDVIAKLNTLREIRPDTTWKTNSRAILLTQVSRGGVVQPTHWFSFFESTMMQRFFLELTRPVSMAFVILLALLGGSYASVQAANQSTPGNPLYIAKIISERTQQALTFDNAKKAKLNLDFAVNRVEELQKVTNGTDIKKESVEELTTDFKAQIEEIKARVAKIPLRQGSAGQAPVTKQQDVEQNKIKETAVIANDKTDDAGKAKVASAVVEKLAVGIDYYDPRAEMIARLEKQFNEKNYKESAVTLQTLKEVIDNPVEIKKATTTEDKKPLLEKASSSEIIE